MAKTAVNGAEPAALVPAAFNMPGAALLRRHAYGVLIPTRFMATMLHLIITSVLINYKKEARIFRV